MSNVKLSKILIAESSWFSKPMIDSFRVSRPLKKKSERLFWWEILKFFKLNKKQPKYSVV